MIHCHFPSNKSHQLETKSELIVQISRKDKAWKQAWTLRKFQIIPQNNSIHLSSIWFINVKPKCKNKIDQKRSKSVK